MKKFTWFAILVSIGVLVASSAPIIYFSIFPNSNLVFLGRRYTNSQDVYTYASFIEQAKAGRNLFENQYTSEPQEPSLLRPSYLLIGKFANLTNISSINAYHISRIIFCIFFFFVLWKFLDIFFKDQKSKFITYAIVLTSSGIGLLIYKWFPDSADLWIPESNTFFSLGEAPHFILSQALMLLGYYFFIDYIRSKKVSRILLSMLFFLILSFEHPFNLVVIAPVIFLTALWGKLPWIISGILGLGSGIGLGYAYYSTLSNPTLAIWQNQNVLLSPSPILYVTGFGFILILAIVGIEKLINENLLTSHKLLITWITVCSFLLYFPVNFQRRLIEGIHIPLAILATMGLLFLTQKYKENKQNLLISLSIIILSVTSIFMIYTDFRMISQDSDNNYYYHISSAEMTAVKWLGAETTTNDTILSNWYIGNLIPGIIGRKVYIGHKIQTANWNGKSQALDLFVGNSDISSSQKFLNDNHITYIFLGKNDMLIQNGFKPENYSNLKSVYEKDGVSIYKVVNE
jgi:hypothetical protein